MLTGRQLNMEDYGAILRRRYLLIVIPVVLGVVGAYLIARQLPPKYTSTSLILIEQPKVPSSIVPSVVGNDLVSRLANMQEQILSRSRLEPLIERYGLYKDDVNSTPKEVLVERMRKDILVKPVTFSNTFNSGDSSQQGNQVPGFQISFTAETPRLAQAVCTEITSMFVEENLRLRERRAEGTANFIATQLEQAKQRLDEQNAKLADFKRKYFGSLPDQEQSTIQILGTLTTQLNSLTESQGRIQQDRTYTESLLTQQLDAWKAEQSGASPQTLQNQLAALQNKLMDLKSRYTDSYPDVVKTKADIASLQTRIAQQQKADASQKGKENSGNGRAVEPTQVRRLRATLHSLDDAMKNNQREQARIHAQIDRYQAKLNMTPAVEQEYKDITRNDQTALAFYNSLLAKEDTSKMSTSLEQRQEGEQFEVLDPADLPHKPSFPDYLRFAGGGFAVGLLIGLGIVFMLEMKDKALRDERDIEFFLGLPTLALVPAVNHGNGKRSLLGRLRHPRIEAAKTR